MHVIIPPVSGLEGTDYRKIDAGPNSPSPRWGHSASVIDDQIYMFGGSGSLTGGVLDEDSSVWVFDTTRNKWSQLTPAAASELPTARLNHASAASEHPRAIRHRRDEGTAPQLTLDPSRDDMLPEPEAATTYGTLIILGGTSASSQQFVRPSRCPQQELILS